MNFFSFLKPNKEVILQIKENTPHEVRKVKSEKQRIVYNTAQDWLKVQNFNSEGMELTYYLQVSDNHKSPLIKKLYVRDINL